MEDQTILLVDETGNPTGEYESKIICHTGQGKRHLAITVFVVNSTGEVLLQKRKHKVFDNIWDDAGATHQLHRDDGSDETDEEATLRCLNVEWGIDTVTSLKNLGGFNYFAQYGDLCENEHCKLLLAEYDGEVLMNKAVAYKFQWMDKNKFLEDIEENPGNYTPWCIESVKILKKNSFWG